MTEFRCSFCNASAADLSAKGAPRLISGPMVFICGECVLLCVDILAEEGCEQVAKDKLELIAERDKLREELRGYKLAVQSAALALSRGEAMVRHIACMWCEKQLADDAEAKEHVATCERHPAVVALAQAQAKRSKRR